MFHRGICSIACREIITGEVSLPEDNRSGHPESIYLMMDVRKSDNILKQAAQGGGAVTIPGGDQEPWRCGTERTWSVCMVGVG